MKKSKERLQLIFENNKDHFSNNGGDIQNFINCCKMAHGRRVFGGGRKAWKKHINVHDIIKGFELYKLSKKGSIPTKSPLMHMYL